jgi:membrane associated rhomboid family serine protease
MLRNEEHKRLSTDLPSVGDSARQELPLLESTPLSKLTLEEFVHLRTQYLKLTPYVRTLFCFLAVFVLLWDVMLFRDQFYESVFAEKIFGQVFLFKKHNLKTKTNLNPKNEDKILSGSF